MGGSFIFERIEPAFEINRVGYIQKEQNRGWNKGTGLFRFSPRINKYHIRRIATNVNYEYVRDLFTTRYIDRWLRIFPDFTPDPVFGTVEQSTEGERSINEGIRIANNFSTGADLTVSLMNEMSFAADYNYFTATELTGDYSGSNFKMDYHTKPLNKGADFAAIFSFKSGTLYNFNQKYVGSQKGFSIDADGRLSRNVLTSLLGDFSKTFNPEDNIDGRYLKLSSNTTWMFTKDFYVRLHAQGKIGTTYYEQKQIYNDYLLSFLLSWEYRPGSFLYLAYNEGRFDATAPNGTNHFQLKNRTLIFKISYFFSV